MSKTSPPHRSRVPQIDLLKGWSILGVIFFHMSFASRFGGNVLAALAGIRFFFAWAAIGFFFCAGFLFATSSGEAEPAGSYALKRAKRLLLPWIGLSLTYKFLLIAGHHFHLVTTAIPVRMGDSRWHELVQFIMWPGGPQLYFLPLLFATSVLFHLLLHRVRQESALWLAALLLIVAFGWLGAGEPHGDRLVIYPAYAATYLIGILAARPAFLIPIQRRRFFFPVIALCFAGLCFSRPTLAYLAVPLAAYPLQRFVTGPPGSLVSYLGRRAEPIYLYHTPIVLPFLSIVLAKCLPGTPWLLIPVLTALAIALSLLIARAISLADGYRLRIWRPRISPNIDPAREAL